MTEFLADLAHKLNTLRKHHDTRSPDHRGNGGSRPVHDYHGDMDADHVRMKLLSLTLGLSAISTGLDQIARGRNEEGLRVARHGLDFLRAKISEANGSRERSAG